VVGVVVVEAYVYGRVSWRILRILGPIDIAGPGFEISRFESHSRRKTKARASWHGNGAAVQTAIHTSRKPSSPPSPPSTPPPSPRLLLRHHGIECAERQNRSIDDDVYFVDSVATRGRMAHDEVWVLDERGHTQGTAEGPDGLRGSSGGCGR